ncbi:NF038129 family PEP-CTERM protein [Massilia psychrophila]|uniref:PEP-CTERM protein-sorting domain-containing protein n=1 Tax=Massilia psychrophila TaxID=1603353 RepID=A0A2G8T568_9BURK|nr:NF038129 family PEP-CTERM protein [Massilia psychrophila]PIL41205.1 hypothetical protein CR103_03695 [Massilia psychrophila]GGE67460.1 hypothetical protein GCM10008020_09820 [Massilia psychrophila]
MINAKTFLRQCLLALTLAATALGALAGPTSFHVNLNTSALAKPTYIDLFFSAASNAAPASATVSNFTGAFGTVDYADGAVVFNADGSITIGNSPFSNMVGFNVLFGDTFGFDVSFNSDFLNGNSIDGSTFSVSALDAGLNPIGGPLVTFDLFGGAGIAVGADGQFASVTAVPEPSELLLMMTGLGLIGFVHRRRKQRAVAAPATPCCRICAASCSWPASNTWWCTLAGGSTLLTEILGGASRLTVALR